MRIWQTIYSKKNLSFSDKIAINLDAKDFNQNYVVQLETFIDKVKLTGFDITLLFIEAGNQAIIHRYNESRRPHPASGGERSLAESIDFERKQMMKIANHTDAIIINTDALTIYQLRSMVQKLCKNPEKPFVLLQSFAYKHTIPADSNYVFDLRGLPNPYWITELKALNGQDKPVAKYLDTQADCQEMFDDIYQNINKWLPNLIAQGRKNLVISLGCTGGQHRSVYMVERLYERLKATPHYIVEKRHLGLH